MKKLHSVNEGLKKFAHVNKKAFEQYSNFTKQRDTLIKRREELDTSAESIEELVQVLDQRKDEAIERTFKQVAKNFEEVFEKLVPAGRGRLIIQRRIDQVCPHRSWKILLLTLKVMRRTRRLTKKRRRRRAPLITTLVSLLRFPSTPRWTKAFGSSSYLEARSHWWLLQLVSHTYFFASSSPDRAILVSLRDSEV